MKQYYYDHLGVAMFNQFMVTLSSYVIIVE